MDVLAVEVLCDGVEVDICFAWDEVVFFAPGVSFCVDGANELCSFCVSHNDSGEVVECSEFCGVFASHPPSAVAGVVIDSVFAEVASCEYGHIVWFWLRSYESAFVEFRASCGETDVEQFFERDTAFFELFPSVRLESDDFTLIVGVDEFGVSVDFVFGLPESFGEVVEDESALSPCVSHHNGGHIHFGEHFAQIEHFRFAPFG